MGSGYVGKRHRGPDYCSATGLPTRVHTVCRPDALMRVAAICFSRICVTTEVVQVQGSALCEV